MSKVDRYCAISNYLRHSDPELFELFTDLCQTKNLIPKKGRAGLTLLRPDKALADKLIKMAKSNAKEATTMLQSLLLCDPIQSLQDFKGPVVTFHGEKLDVKSVDAKKVTLGNGAEIQMDPDFKPTEDRQNISVCVISGDFVGIDQGEKVPFNKPSAKPVKKGGVEYDVNRAGLWKQIVVAQCDEKLADRDIAMEVIMHLYHKANNDQKRVIRSKVSYDTLGSLFILLRPYSRSDSGIYVPDDLLAKLNQGSTESFKKNNLLFVTIPDCCTKFDEMINLGASEYKSQYASLKSKSSEMAIVMSTGNAPAVLSDAYGSPQAETQRKLAEAECRVLSALLQETANGMPLTPDEIFAITNSLTLDTPSMCANTEFITGMGIGYYYSTVYLIARSDAFDYVPHIDEECASNISENITDDNAFISLHMYFRGLNQDKREKSQNVMQGMLSLLQ